MNNIALIGYRGSGKSTVAKLLAAKLGWDSVDTDEMVVETAQKSIRQIFEEDGEATFREYEKVCLEYILEHEQLVIATGGGIIIQPENCARLRQNAWVVFLDLPPVQLWQRIQADTQTTENRPNLTGGGREEIETILARRRPIYESLANDHLHISGMTPEEIVSAIIANLPGEKD